MKILIIGGTRFMGPIIVKRLHEHGHEITVFHRGQTKAVLPDGVREILGDRNNLNDFSAEFKRLRPDIVLDMMLLNENQAGQLMSTMAGIAKRLVAASSCDVYFNFGLMIGTESGDPDIGRISEHSHLRVNYYPYRTKVKSKDDPMYSYDKIPVEKIVLSNPDLPATVLRLPMVYGPGDYRHRFYEYVKRMADKREVIILENSQAGWRMIRGYSENCAEAISLAIENEKSSGEVFNVGDSDTLTEKEWILRLGKIFGWNGKVVTLPNDKLPGHLQTDTSWQYDLDVDTSLIRKELGFREPVSRDAALRKMIEWQLTNPPSPGDADFDYAAEDKALASFSNS
jgi:nucleoside-diphosphate-sugar epimerase